jgi:signal transduction histidine kinase/ActR/RegA family two-component response regulator
MSPRDTLWNRLTRQGSGAEGSYDDARRWVLRNTIFLLTGLVAAMGVLLFGTVGEAEIFLASAFVSLGCFAGYALSRIGSRRSASLCACLSLNAALFFNGQNFGAGLFESGYLVAVGLAFLTLERQDTGTICTVLTVTLGAVALGTLTWWPQVAELGAGPQAALRVITVALVIGYLGACFMYFLVHRDRTIARLDEVARMAEAASQAKSRFLANMSHELRTPMNGVLGVLDILDDSPLGERQRDHVQSARAAGRALLGIIDDILDLAKVEAGMMILDAAPFDLRAMVESEVHQIAVQVRDKDVEVVTRYGTEVPTRVVGDAKRIRQVLVNLLGNAAKFTEAGEIAVSVSCHPGEAGMARFSVTVSDTGIGIPAEAQSSIFEKFQQVDDSATRARGGTGLGLAIVKELVTRMQGSVMVESELGRGSRFCITLPFPVATIDAVPAAAALHADRGSDAGRRVEHPVEHPAEHEVAQDRLPLVLVVEDNVLNQKVAVHRLERLGCRVDVASDGVEALTRIEETPYDLVFMDLQMPRMDGIQTTLAIRERERAHGRRLPIVAMTAHAFPEDRRRCLDAGMDDHVSKPLVDHALQAVIQRLMDRAHGLSAAP